MDDLFYFSKSSVELIDLAQIAESFAYKWEIITLSNKPDLNIFYGQRWFWQWSKLDEDDDFNTFEPSELKIISALQPVSIFSISYHSNSIVLLQSFLKAVLIKYSGWIGCDNENFEPIYSLANIDNLQYPH